MISYLLKHIVIKSIPLRGAMIQRQDANLFAHIMPSYFAT